MTVSVIDALDGFATLVKRSQTLGGSVPLRVAQACVPLLEGNAWGYQINLTKRIELRKRFGRWTVAAFEGGDGLAALLRGGLPMLGDVLAPAWGKRVQAGIALAGRSISLFTGLFVRPPNGVRLRQSSTANRRSFAYAIDEVVLDDVSGYVPIVLDIVPRGEVDSFTLEHEIATLAVLPSRISIARASLEDAPDVVRTHVAFYDAEYFQTKQRGQVARKYRDEIRASQTASGDAAVTIVDGGPRLVEPGRPARAHRVTGPSTTDLVPDRLVVKNAVAFEATFDGSRVAVEPDRDQLERYARDVRERWSGITSHQGALLYLTKYFTPHPPGEPHLFTKPATLIATSPGSSTVIEGRNGSGYDVLRGVVRTDTFHATPSVFHLWQPGQAIAVPEGAILAELFPCPRDVLETKLEVVRGGAATV